MAPRARTSRSRGEQSRGYPENTCVHSPAASNGTRRLEETVSVDEHLARESPCFGESARQRVPSRTASGAGVSGADSIRAHPHVQGRGRVLEVAAAELELLRAAYRQEAERAEAHYQNRCAALRAELYRNATGVV